MGVHVDRLRERALEHAQEKKAAANAAESQAVCPYSAAHKTEDNKSIYETLMSDDRVSKDLSANIIMALFRTGIDSVSWRLLMAILLVYYVSASFSSFRLVPSLVLLFSSHAHIISAIFQLSTIVSNLLKFIAALTLSSFHIALYFHHNCDLPLLFWPLSHQANVAIIAFLCKP